MNTAHEWREDVSELMVDMWELLPDIKYKQVTKAGVIKYTEKEIISIIQNLLTTHSAHLVERIEALDVNHFCECKRQCFHSHNLIKQVKNIIQGNESTDQYKCQSYSEDGKVIDCTCGKCDQAIDIVGKTNGE